MPAPEQILNGLRTIANQWQILAILWHVYFGVLAVGLILGVRPSKRVGGVLLGDTRLAAALSKAVEQGAVFQDVPADATAAAVVARQLTR